MTLTSIKDPVALPPPATLNEIKGTLRMNLKECRNEPMFVAYHFVTEALL